MCGGHYNIIKVGGDIQRPLNDPTITKRGQWSIGRDGYVYQNTIATETEKSRTALQHRVVMQEILGRPLLPGESVHHKNGVRHDNRPENLELWSTAQPSGQRVKDKVTWAKEILALYGTE